MADTVNVEFVHAYTAELHRLLAQQETKLRQAVRVKSGVVGKTYHFERLGASDLVAIVSRHQATPILNPVHSRRRVTFSDRGGAILLDRHDEIKMLIAPKNDYARNHAESYNRFLDDLIIAAATGNSIAVDAADAASNVAIGSANQIAAGSVGLTFEKVLQASRIMNEANVPQGDRYFAISPQGLEDLLQETEVTSSDFNQLMALKTGTLNGPYMGFSWIMSTRLAISSTTRTCIAWHRDGLGLAIGLEIEIDIARRKDLNNAWQVHALVSAGATRIEESRVIQVDITEAT